MPAEDVICARAALFDAVVCGASLQDLTDCAYLMLGNPIRIASDRGEIISSAGYDKVDDQGWEEMQKNGFISESVKQQVEKARAAATGKSFIFEWKSVRRRMMMNVPSARVLISLRITLTEVQRLFSELDREIFELFADAVYYYMRDSELVTNFDANTDEFFLHEVFNGHINASASMPDIIERLSFRDNDHFVFLTAKPVRDDFSTKWLDESKRLVKSLFPDSIFIVYEELLVCLVILKERKYILPAELAKLSALLAKSKMMGCLGCVSRDLRLINSCYAQTRDILHIGTRSKNAAHIFFADTMLPDYLLSKIGREDLEFLLFEPVVQIFEADRRAKTELLKSLYAYLLVAGNISAASRLLGIHYNSMKQRLWSIAEMIGDRDLTALSMSLMLSIKALKLLHPGELGDLYELEYLYKMNWEEGGRDE